MTQFINIHTHKPQKKDNIFEIYNCNFNKIVEADSDYFSISIHPWNIDNETEIPHDIFYDLPENCIAIGEIGLDKLHSETFEHQKIIFDNALLFLPDDAIPVIIHCVKAHTDLIQVIKANKVQNPIIIHGFNNNENILEIYLKEKFYISLGKILFADVEKAKTIINKIPKDKLFMETDDSNYTIEEVYEKASNYLNMSIDELKTITFGNAKQIFTQLQ